MTHTVHTLLTLSADLCQPNDVDTGPERGCATQSLRCALGTSVCGARAQLCQLVEPEGGAAGGPVAGARPAKLLRAVAELDHHIVQEAFGEAGWPLQFRAAVARLLSQHAPSDYEPPRTKPRTNNEQRPEEAISETMVLDLIKLVGFVVVNNPQLQETICDGWSVVKTLCMLPANWLVTRHHSQALLPTLVALAERPSAATAIRQETNMEMLNKYIERPEAQELKLVQIIRQGRSKKASSKK